MNTHTQNNKKALEKLKNNMKHSQNVYNKYVKLKGNIADTHHKQNSNFHNLTRSGDGYTIAGMSRNFVDETKNMERILKTIKETQDYKLHNDALKVIKSSETGNINTKLLKNVTGRYEKYIPMKIMSNEHKK